MLRPDFWEIFGSEGMTPEARVALVQDRLSYLDDRAQRQFGTLMAEQLLKLGDSIVLRVVKVIERPPHSSDSALFARLAILNAGRVVFDDLSKESDRHFHNPPVVDMGAADLLSVLLGPALSELELAGQSAGASDQGDGIDSQKANCDPRYSWTIHNLSCFSVSRSFMYSRNGHVCIYVYLHDVLPFYMLCRAPDTSPNTLY